MSEERDKLFGYWGKFKMFDGEDEPRMIWIGKMSRAEMIEFDDTFRHNFRAELTEDKFFTAARIMHFDLIALGQTPLAEMVDRFGNGEKEFCGQCGAEVLGHHACQMFQG